MENVLLSWNNTIVDGNGIPVIVQSPQIATWGQLNNSNTPALMQSVCTPTTINQNELKFRQSSSQASSANTNQSSALTNFANIGIQNFSSDSVLTTAATNALYQQSYAITGQAPFQQLRPQYQMTSNGTTVYQPTNVLNSSQTNVSNTNQTTFFPGSFVINTPNGSNLFPTGTLQTPKKPKKRGKAGKKLEKKENDANKASSLTMNPLILKTEEKSVVEKQDEDHSVDPLRNPPDMLVKLDNFPVGCNADGTPIYNFPAPKFEDPALKPFQCEQCHKRFGAMKSLRNHRLIHSEIKPHKCTVCGKSFVRADKMKSHEITHLNLKPYECSTCGRRFTRSDKLKIHHRIHTGVKPYSCQFCPKSFTRSDKLRIHERIHTRIKPYPCSICGKCFSRSDKRKMHEQIHSLGPKPHRTGTKSKKSKKAALDGEQSLVPLSSLNTSLLTNNNGLIQTNSNGNATLQGGSITSHLPAIIGNGTSSQDLAAVIAQQNGLFQAIGQDGTPIPAFFSTTPQGFSAVQASSSVQQQQQILMPSSTGMNNQLFTTYSATSGTNSNLAAVMAVALGRQIQQAQQTISVTPQQISAVSSGGNQDEIKIQQQALLEQLRQQNSALSANGQQFIYPIMASGVDNNILTTVVNSQTSSIADNSVSQNNQ